MKVRVWHAALQDSAWESLILHAGLQDPACGIPILRAGFSLEKAFPAQGCSAQPVGFLSCVQDRAWERPILRRVVGPSLWDSYPACRIQPGKGLSWDTA
jgi:hypothetical protein